MLKRILLLVIILMLVGTGILLAQEPASNIKEKLLRQIGPITVAPTPDLRPSLWVDCCGDTNNKCEKILENKGFMLVNEINIYVYNAGGANSGPATGKVEFFDILTNTSKTYNFSLGSVTSKGWGVASPNKIVGPFIVKKADGIKISVTFNVGKIPKTNTSTYKECSILY